MPTYANWSGWVISIIAGRFEVIADNFDDAYGLAKRLTRINNAKEHFEYNRHFLDITFSEAQRPVSHEVFQQLEDRGTQYEPLLMSLHRADAPALV